MAAVFPMLSTALCALSSSRSLLCTPVLTKCARHALSSVLPPATSTVPSAGTASALGHVDARRKGVWWMRLAEVR